MRDASVLLAYLKKERGWEIAESLLGGEAAVSAINWAEALSKMWDDGNNPERVSQELTMAGILGQLLFIIACRWRALRVTQLRQLTKSLGLSLGDRACLALGQTLRVPVYTAERRWVEVNAPNLSVTLIRK